MKLKVADTEIQVNEDYTLSTSEIAKFYGVAETTIRRHKKEHSDELIENQHFIVIKNKLNKPAILWTLEGVYMLGFFIKSERAKKYRKAVAQLLTEIKKGKAQIRPTQPHLIENNEKMVEELIKRSDIVRGYQGQIAKLENELAKKQSEILQAQDKQKAINKGIQEAINTRLRQIDKNILQFITCIDKKISEIDELVNAPLQEDKNFISLGGDAYLPKNGRWKELE